MKTLLLFFALTSLSVSAGTIKTYDCSETEAKKIKDAVSWLKNNLGKIDQKMGKNKLMDWPGNSRTKFKNKLDKTLKFYCISHKSKCGADPKKPGYLLGKVYPVFAQKRVNLCTNNIRTYAKKWGRDKLSIYIHVIAHEIGHLVRVNGHRNKCADKYTKPRFSQSLGLASEYAHAGDTYNSNDYTVLCP